MGTRPGLVLRRAGMSREALENPDGRLPWLAFARLLNEAAAATGDGHFGLHYGFERHPSDLGLLGYVCMNMPALGPMLEQVSRYAGLLGDGMRVESRVAGNRLTRIYSLPELPLGDDERRHEYDTMVAGAYQSIILTVGEAVRPLQVHLKHGGTGACVAEYRRVFGVVPRFAMPKNALVLPRELMLRRVVNANPEILALLRPHLEARAHGGPEAASLLLRTEQEVATRLAAGEPRVEQVARALGLGTRTLQRRLAGAGLSFGQVLHRVRERLARDYLAGPRLSLAEVAFLLGYSEISAFNRAFRQWTGQSPSAYRAARRRMAPSPLA